MSEAIRWAECVALGALSVLGSNACGNSTDLQTARPKDIVVSLSSDIPTVVNVTWRTDQPAIGYVEYGTTREMQYSTPLEEEQLVHATNLLGLAPNTTYYYRVVAWAANDAGGSEIATIATGDLGLQLPTFTVEGEGQPQLVVAPLVRQKVALVIDPAGDVVWAHNETRDLEIHRARLSADGQSVLYNAVGPAGDPVEGSALVRVAVDGSSESSTAVPWLRDDFVEHADGTLAALVLDERDFGGSPLRGDKIVEIGPDGALVDVWSVWDCFDPAAAPGDQSGQGWTFANALDYSDAEQAYYVGLRNFSSIVKVDRATGNCAWVLGSTGATFAFADGSEAFVHPEQFQLAGDHIVIMDSDGAGDGTPRVIEYQLDEDAMLATQVASLPAEAGTKTPLFGEPNRFPGGESFINWSEGRMQRLDSSGLALWTLTAADAVFGYHSLVDSLYSNSARTP